MRLSPTPPRYGASPPRFGRACDSSPPSDTDGLLARREHGTALQSALAGLSGSRVRSDGVIPRRAVGVPAEESEEAGVAAANSNLSSSVPLLRKILTSVPESQIDESIGELSSEEQDILMKGLYIVLADRSASISSAALRWHGRLVATAGLGSIMRVLNDRSAGQEM